MHLKCRKINEIIMKYYIAFFDRLYFYSKCKYYSINKIFPCRLINIQNQLSGIHFVSMCAKIDI